MEGRRPHNLSVDPNNSNRCLWTAACICTPKVPTPGGGGKPYYLMEVGLRTVEGGTWGVVVAGEGEVLRRRMGEAPPRLWPGHPIGETVEFGSLGGKANIVVLCALALSIGRETRQNPLTGEKRVQNENPHTHTGWGKATRRSSTRTILQ